MDKVEEAGDTSCDFNRFKIRAGTQFKKYIE